MNKQEAYSILGLNQSSSPEELKKKYRDLAKTNHPDVNKSPGAEDKFKKINEAYEYISSGKSDLEGQMPFGVGVTDNPFGGGFNPFGGGFNPFANMHHQQQSRHQQFNRDSIEINTTISFRESILGCTRDLSFNRNGKCDHCNGNGIVNLHNGCQKCGGKGKIVGRQGNMIFEQGCQACGGKVSQAECSECNGKGWQHTTVNITVNIPPGVTDDNILRLQGMGNFCGSMMNMDQYTEALLHLTIIPQEGLRLEDNNVIHNLSISLIDALSGCNVFVPTINGNQEIKVPVLSKNKEEIILPGLGPNNNNQKVILEVNYPADISRLISALRPEDISEEIINEQNNTDIDNKEIDYAI